MVKLIFSDMDGTFLASDKTIPAENMKMLQYAASRGVQFVPCTGRNINGIPAELSRLSNVSYAVCCNGALVAELPAGRVIHEIDIDKNEVHRLFVKFAHLPITFDLFADGRVFTAQERWHYLDEMPIDEATRHHVKEVRTCYPGSVDEMIDACDSICRINIFFLDDRSRDQIWKEIDSRSDLIRASSQPCNIEITHAGADKGSGLAWLCSHLDVRLSDSVAFGDSSNDISMLRAAEDGVAVANALPECRAAADHMALSNDEAGVGRYMMELFQKERN